MADPEIAADATEFQKLAKAASSLQATVTAFAAGKEAEAQLAEAKQMLKESAGVLWSTACLYIYQLWPQHSFFLTQETRT